MQHASILICEDERLVAKSIEKELRGLGYHVQGVASTGQRALELPQGGWEMEVENPEDLARGELREETGLDAGRMTYLGWMWIAYGFNRQKQHVFLAEELSASPAQRDDEEHDLTVRSLPVTEFERMMLDGEIRDNCTVAAWGLYLMWKARQKN